jgi:oligopeptide transport system permease protein
MIMIYGLMNKELIFAEDPTYTKMNNNRKVNYMYSRWESYGYLHYVPYSDYLSALKKDGTIDEDTRSQAVLLGKTSEFDSELTKEYIEKFTKYYTDKGYTVERRDAVMMGGNKLAEGGQPILFAHKPIPLITRLGNYFSKLITIDHIHNAK